MPQFGYRQLGCPDCGGVLAYLQRLGGYSRAQLTRLVLHWTAGKTLVKRYSRPQHAFARRYTSADATLLAEVDCRHEHPVGPSTARVVRRQYGVFGDPRFVRLVSKNATEVPLNEKAAPLNE